MKEDWPVCERRVHLLGGLSAVSHPQSDVVTIWPKTVCNKPIETRIPAYNKLFSVLSKLDMNIIGVEFVTHPSEAFGVAPTQWRSYSKQGNAWENWDAGQRWSQLGNASYFNKDGLCYDLSKRISYQLGSLSGRLKDLSYSYRNQLNSIEAKGKPSKSGKVHNGYTDIVYQKFQALLFEACILRDYLAEFTFNFVRAGALKNNFGKEVTTASGLLKALNAEGELSGIEREFKAVLGNEGWLKRLGVYRDLVMHSAPINIANHRLYCIKESLPLTDGREIRFIRLPIPSNPEEIYRERCKREDFTRYIESVEIFVKSDLPQNDCLEYSLEIVGKLSKLSMECSKISPYKPMMPHFVKTKNGMVSSLRVVES